MATLTPEQRQEIPRAGGESVWLADPGLPGSALVLGFSGWNRIGQETKNQT